MWIWIVLVILASIYPLFLLIGKLVMFQRMRGVAPLHFSAEEEAAIKQKWQNIPIRVLVNPFGGNGAGMLSFTRCVRPTLTALQLPFTVLFTQRKGHAAEVVSILPSRSPYQAVFAISGDGLVHEVVQGMMKRRQSLLAESSGALQDPAVAFIPITHIPAGTGNGISVSMGLTHHPARALRRVLLEADPAGVPIDVLRIEQFLSAQNSNLHSNSLPNISSNANINPNQDGDLSPEGGLQKPIKVEHSLMSFNYGLVGEGDNIMENDVRWLGWLRDLLVPLYLILRAKQYAVRLEFDAGPGHHDASQALAQHDFLEGLSRDAAGNYVYEGPIFYLIGASLTHIAHEFKCTPLAEPNDGQLDALVCVENNRWKALRLFLSLQEGLDIGQFKRMGGRYLKVRRMRIVPLVPSIGDPSIVISTDGEILPNYPTEINVLNGIGRFIA